MRARAKTDLGRVGLAVALAAAAAVAGCYKPDILDGGFKCATSGKACPEGFVCASDNLCRRPGSHPQDASMCSQPPVTPLCTNAALSGICDPTCQTGCECGRCNVSAAGAAVCGSYGAKTLGAVCIIGNGDDCAPGFICLQETCGNLLGRCYRHCTDDSVCSGRICQVVINDANDNPTSFRACDLAPQACDPVNNTGCPSPALNCYLTSANETLCDCPNDPAHQGVMGDACTFYNDCAPSFICISNVGGLPGPHCHPVCSLTSPSCPATRTCVATGSFYGYCAPSPADAGTDM
jgi:hypothetical protein